MLKKLFVWSLLSLLSLVFGLLAAEYALRLGIKSAPDSKFTVAVPHATLGWTLTPGKSWSTSAEFVVENNSNALSLSETVEFTPTPGCDVLALGDSHTIASGVATQDAWPNAAESALASASGAKLKVWNGGVMGFSVGQYLTNFRRLNPIIHPRTVVIGFSTATDFYDVMPRSRGGFVYYDQFGRTYFDLDASGALSEHHELDGVNRLVETGPSSMTMSQRLRMWLATNSQLYMRFKASRLAVWLASQSADQRSIWPSMDSALKIAPDATDQYRFDLVEAILRQLATEAKASGARVILLKIPYLPEVYDEVWNNSFGLYPDLYRRDAGSARVQAIAQSAGMEFLDATPALAREAKARGHWLHWPIDRHPTAEGQKVIADEVAKALASEASQCAAASAMPSAAAHQ
jgi:lysophospholipase L1-like esterase